MEPVLAVRLALDVAQQGLCAGEMPIGAVVMSGDEVSATAHAQEQALGRRIVHADLLALQEANRILGFRRVPAPLTLAVNLEPCLMCLGAAITLGVEHVWFGLESPNDGAAAPVAAWNPPVEQVFFRKPTRILGGFLRQEVVRQFDAYAAGDGPDGMKEWARGPTAAAVPLDAVGISGADRTW
ncbi:nucleoside deaminase [Arthrobacter sp. JSM 101049]|uniref:nucleoside deaminase n=1 Tax=Arthrobacter sp. JSM 101049 TaxID=929097 RepID=UPI0035616A5F